MMLFKEKWNLHLLSGKLAYSFLIFPMILCVTSGCAKDFVRYDDFLEKPSAVKQNGRVDVNLGFTAASACWIKPSTKIEGDAILVSGTLAFREMPQTLPIKLPNPEKDYHIFWIDGDDKKARRTEIQILVEGKDDKAIKASEKDFTQKD